MSIMVIEIYDALIEAGASVEKAHAAAKVLADAVVKPDLSPLALKTDLEPLRLDLASIKSDLGWLKWIARGVGIGVALLVFKAFFPHFGGMQ